LGEPVEQVFSRWTLALHIDAVEGDQNVARDEERPWLVPGLDLEWEAPELPEWPGEFDLVWDPNSEADQDRARRYAYDYDAKRLEYYEQRLEQLGDELAAFDASAWFRDPQTVTGLVRQVPTETATLFAETAKPPNPPVFAIEIGAEPSMAPGYGLLGAGAGALVAVVLLLASGLGARRQNRWELDEDEDDL
jgi:hypothetical protein